MKINKAIWGIFTCLLLPILVSAQQIDNTASYKSINSDEYFRLNYENDFFSATDQYYTQGIHIEVVAPWVARFPLSYALIRPSGFGQVRYGLGIEHNGYTPSSIGSDAILYGDRPFAASLFLKTFAISTDTVRKQRFSSALSTGVNGPAAGGKEMQESIHRWLNNVTPHGWDNQVSNDVILNYQVNYDKQLLALGKSLLIDANAMLRAGSLSNRAALGITLMGGYFDSPYSGVQATKKNFRIYAYEHPEVNVVGYEATLQGGLFNRNSPYTISAADMERLVFQNRFGFVVVYRRIYLEYFQSVRSREFTTSKMHVWGGVQLAFGL